MSFKKKKSVKNNHLRRDSNRNGKKLCWPIYGEEHRRLNVLRDQRLKKIIDRIEEDRKESELRMRNLHQSINDIIKFGMDDF